MRPLLFFAFVAILLSVIGCQKPFSTNNPVVIDSIPPKDTTIVIDTTLTDTTVLLRIFSVNPDSAKAGDTIVVTGTGFGSISVIGPITINGLPLSVIDITNTTFTLKLPADFTSGPIKISYGDTSIISPDSVTALAQDSVINSPWKQRASIQFEGVFPNATIFSKGFTIDGKGYFLTSILRQFDPVLNTWTTKPAPPLRLNTGFAFVVKGKFYAGSSEGGNPGSLDVAKQVWQYDPATESWTRKADFPGAARLQAFSFSTTTFGYIGGGNQPQLDTTFKDFWRYDSDSDSWTQLQNYPGKAYAAFAPFTAFTLNNAGYVFEAGMGSTVFPTGFVYKDTPLWQYNESNDTWVQKATFDKVQNFVSPTIFSIGTKAYLTFGTTDPPVTEGVYNNFWEYNAGNNSWIQRTDVPGNQRRFSRSFSLGNKGYVGLGSGDNFNEVHADFWEYTPE